ncbi:MAG: phage minor head protein [Aurantimonas endophytica]|uniref:endonuclease toxin domain-containing protein n=1 Tax=Aurantimonas endophytica TaxID=1522175 RepID=UPI0030027631
MLRPDEGDDGGAMRQELNTLKADAALTRLEFALVRESWLETRRVAGDVAERAARRERFAARLAEAALANEAMLLDRLGALRLSRRDIPKVTAARRDALATWDRADALARPVLPADPDRAAARRLFEDALVHRFVGRINAERQQALGIGQYIWRSRDDRRVRPLHAAYDDQVFDWDEPPEDGHPGEAINCRCIAEPFFDDAPEWRPTIDRDYDRAITLAVLAGGLDAVVDFVSDFIPSADDLWALLAAIRTVAETGSEAAQLAYLLVKEQLLGLTAAETARRDALLGAARDWVDGLAASLADAPDLARALVEAMQAVEARPEALDAAHRQGLATRADVEAAYRERARLRTLAALYGLATVASGGTAARGLVARFLRRQGADDDVSAAELAALARRARVLSPDADWERVANPGIVWGKGIRAQGEPWERYLAATGELGERIEDRARNFKTFDFYEKEAGLATSAKTLDTTAAGYVRDPKNVFGRLKSYVDRIAIFTKHSVNGYRLDPSLIKHRRIELAIPPKAREDQLAQINRARTYAEARGIAFNVRIIE